MHMQVRIDTYSHPDFLEALRKINKHFEKRFVEDLALYILLAHRIHTNNSLYTSEWLTRIESVECKELAVSFTAFLERYIHVLDFVRVL